MIKIKSSPPSSWALAKAADLDMTPRISSLPSLVPMVTRSSVWAISLFMGGTYSGFFMGWRLPPPRLMAWRDVDVGGAAVCSACGGRLVVNAVVLVLAARRASTVVSAVLVVEDTIL